MTLLELVVLAVVQGLTEFLPISSSGHLILAPALLGWSAHSLAFDVAVHFGTLAAVLWYFRADLAGMTRALGRQLGGTDTPHGRLALAVIAGTVPVVVAGFLGRDWIEASLRTPAIIAAATAGFGILLWLADRYGRRRRDEFTLGLAGALAIGLAQVLALVPGTSRSGITMTAGLGLGLTREAAARFSFLLSIPVIAAAAALESAKLSRAEAPVDWLGLALAAGLSAVIAYLTIRYFLRLIGRVGMLPFAIYRVLLAAVVVYVLV